MIYKKQINNGSFHIERKDKILSPKIDNSYKKIGNIRKKRPMIINSILLKKKSLKIKQNQKF